MSSANYEIKKFSNQYGAKISITGPKHYLFINSIKSIEWKKSHRLFNPVFNSWEMDYNQQVIEELLCILDPLTSNDEVIAEYYNNLNIFYKNNFDSDSKPKTKSKLKITIKISDRVRLYSLRQIRNTTFIDDSEDKNKFYNLSAYFFKDMRKLIGFQCPNEKYVRQNSTKDLSTWDGLLFPAEYDWDNDCLIFDIGNLIKITEYLFRRGIEDIDIIDERPIYPLSEEISFDLKLWKPQKAAIDVVLPELRENTFSLYQLPPGMGKTEIALRIISEMKVKTLILVNRRDLMYQWCRRAKKRLGIKECGIVGDGIFDPKEITVATVQSLWNYLKDFSDVSLEDESLIKQLIKTGKIEKDKAPIDSPDFFKQFSLVILDEAHIGAANSILSVLRRLVAKYFLGMSATTWRTDGLEPLMFGQFGRPIFEYDINDAIRMGYLVEPKIQVIRSNGIYSESNHKTAEREMKEDIRRNQLITQIVEDAPKPCLVLTTQTSHQDLMKEQFDLAGIENFVIARGKTKSKRRQEILDEIKEGKIEIAIATGIWDEGIDMPNLASVVLSFPGKSSVRLIQRVGRGLRKDPDNDKKCCFIYDIYDNRNRYFRNRFEARKEIYDEFGWL